MTRRSNNAQVETAKAKQSKLQPSTICLMAKNSPVESNTLDQCTGLFYRAGGRAATKPHQATDIHLPKKTQRTNGLLCAIPKQ
jgi:hypothetical protein